MGITIIRGTSTKPYNGRRLIMYKRHSLLHSILLAVTFPMVFAVDLRLYLSSTVCSGVYIACEARDPKDCCGLGDTSSTAQSVSWEGIPSEWLLLLESYKGGNCTESLQSDVSNTRTSVCASGRGGYTGLSYTLFSTLGLEEERKGGCRNLGLERGEMLDIGAGSKCRRADVLILEDGTRHELGGLAGPNYSDVVSSVQSGDVAAVLLG
ncbi:hypothetical protein Micbo1qcDRAFT_208305 [Microdochium bolleyi]|uniref:Uncharacterized protein n=1 Tax=Microdochium bolleyi TaxID=196109 RepID=A0A136IQR9_9PEZI|nr:hypothetical protein Micbo1qcDRAFT_208305 [Microdochium bolleyi]